MFMFLIAHFDFLSRILKSQKKIPLNQVKEKQRSFLFESLKITIFFLFMKIVKVQINIF